MKARLNISIDDVSPHPMSSTSVLWRCQRVLREFPDARFTLFVPTAYWRTMGHTATSEALWLDRHAGFCNELAALDPKSFEIGYHGLHHGIPGESNNDELQHLSYEDALYVMDQMLGGAYNAKMEAFFKPILRPPAWRMSPGAFKAAEEKGIRTFALSPDGYAMATYAGAQEGRRVVYYDCCPPSKPLRLLEKTEIVYHACEWDSNHLDDSACDRLMEFLTRHRDDYEFCFIEGLLDG